MLVNTISAVGFCCRKMRSELVEQGMSIEDARKVVMASIREDAWKIDEDTIANVYNTSRGANTYNQVLWHALREPDDMWDVGQESVPNFADIYSLGIEDWRVTKPAIRAAVMGQERNFQSCISVITVFMLLSHEVKKDDHWGCLEFFCDIPTSKIALAGNNKDGEEKEEILASYYTLIEECMSPFPFPEDSSYHLGPPMDMFSEITVPKSFSIGSKRIKTLLGQGFRVKAEQSDDFVLRLSLIHI